VDLNSYILFYFGLFYFIVIFNVYSCLRNQAKLFLNVTEYTSVISAEQHCFWTIIIIVYYVGT
jgi:hypothetical protein